MSADVELLREAAALMRDRANAASEGPWETGGDGLVWPPRLGDPVSGSTDIEDAEHIASWDPAVALVVADWLDGEADLHCAIESSADKVPEGWALRITSSTLPQAVAVARTFLGRAEQ